MKTLNQFIKKLSHNKQDVELKKIEQARINSNNPRDQVGIRSDFAITESRK